MIKLPLNGKWTQPNDSSKLGSILYSKNINLDENGFLKLSPRSINIFDDSANTANLADEDFNYPTAFGRKSDGSFYLATTNEPFNISLSETTKTIAEDTSSDNPNLTFDSHGVWWQNRFYESTSTIVSYNTSGTWTASAITGLTSGVRHPLCVFKNRNQLCVGNGNVVKQYNTSHSGTTDLTIPSDFEVIGLAYNNYTMGIITRLGNDSEGQNQDSYFFAWDGSTGSADTGVSIGAYTAVCIFPYKSSFVIVNSVGQLLYWNGGGFDELAHFPIYVSQHRWGDLLNYLSYGDNIVVDGDTILFNLGFDLKNAGRYQEQYDVKTPSGVWCYDPEVGLYHRASPSLSKCYVLGVTQANVNTTTNIFTISATIPETGNPIVNTEGVVGGITQGKVYFIIKLSSTTFALAESKELAQAGVKVDVTSADTTNYFWAYDLVDYGTTFSTKSGAIALFDSSSNAYQDYIFGGRLLNTSLNSSIVLNMNVPFLENRGYFVTPKFYLDSKEEQIGKCIIKHRPLDINDAIVVKYKAKDKLRIPTIIPVASLTTDYLTWVSSYEATTTFDLTDIKTAFDNGEEMEIEFTAGCAAGLIIEIANITYVSGTYTLSFSENVMGVTNGGKSYFVIDNWTTSAIVTYDKQDSDGIYNFLIGDNSKAYQFKIELRGYQTTIEDIFFTNLTFKPIQ